MAWEPVGVGTKRGVAGRGVGYKHASVAKSVVVGWGGHSTRPEAVTSIRIADLMSGAMSQRFLLSVHHQLAQYSTQQSSSGNAIADLLVGAVTATMEKAFPEAKLLQLARQANVESVSAPYTGMPSGPYSSNYGMDGKHYPEGLDEAEQE